MGLPARCQLLVTALRRRAAAAGTIPVSRFALRREGAFAGSREEVRTVGDTAQDPVCGMTVEKDKAPVKARHEGNTYYFCAEVCKKRFEKDPERYLR